MTDNKIYMDSIGIVISLTCRDNNYVLMDLTSATASIIVKRPDGDEVEWTGIIVGSVVSYTTIAGDLDVPGNYLFQAKIIKAGATFFSETQKFVVYELYE